MKKLLSILLMLALVASLLPLTIAFGAEGDVAVTVDGKDCTAHVGDILHYTYYMDLSGIDLGEGAKNGKITQLEGRVYYDKTCLRLLTDTEPDEDDIFAPLPNFKNGNVEVSNDNEEFFGYNTSKLSGYSFAAEKVMLTLDFELIGDQPSSVTHIIRNLGSGEVRLIDRSQILIPIKDRVEIRVECVHLPATEATTEAETETASGTQPEPTTEAATEAHSQVGTEPATEPETEPETQVETEPQTEPQTEAQTEAETEAETETETEAPTKPPVYHLLDEATAVRADTTDANAVLTVAVVDAGKPDYVFSEAQLHTMYDISLNGATAKMMIPAPTKNARLYALDENGEPTPVDAEIKKDYDFVEDRFRYYFVFETNQVGRYLVTTSAQPLIRYTIGDVDLDGYMAIVDATLIQRALAGIDDISYTQQLVADFDRDGNMTVVDATAIQRRLAGIS